MTTNACIHAALRGIGGQEAAWLREPFLNRLGHYWAKAETDIYAPTPPRAILRVGGRARSGGATTVAFRQPPGPAL
jgi:hypothetical protein